MSLNVQKTELRKNCKSAILLTVLCFLISAVYAYYIQSDTLFYYNIEIWQESSQISAILLPLIVVLPTCETLYSERTQNYIFYTKMRISTKKYYLNKLISITSTGFFIVFFNSMLLLVFTLYILKAANITDPQLMSENHVSGQFSGYYVINVPFFYGLLLSIWRGILGAIISSLGYVFSRFLHNKFSALLLPFAIVTFFEFSVAIIGIPEYGIYASYLPSGLKNGVVSPATMIVSPLVYMLLSIVVYCVMKRREGLNYGEL